MFNEALRLAEAAHSSVSRFRPTVDRFDPKGIHRIEHYRRRKSGTLYLLEKVLARNLITTTAKTQLLNTMFNALAQVAANSWFIGLVDLAGFTAFNASDTMASHPGWVEWTNYSQSARPLWTQGTAASASITNAAQVVFDMTATGTVHGLFVVTNSTKGGTTGLDWSGAPFTADVAVINGDQIRSTYTLSC